ncbi:MAG: substrate-binding domain-containing protein [Planctomycetia bacterium]|nr:substrate-binding domain-containing protein [Planctomycetia bacterium]
MLRTSLLLSLALVALGCSSKSSTSIVTKYRIGVVPKGTTHDHWKAVRAGALQAAQELGNIEILWDGPSREDERGRQQEIVERFTSTNSVNGIVLAPCDKTTLVEPVKAALAQNKYIVLIDSDLENKPEIQNNPYYLGYVATNNKQGGVEAGKRVLELIKGKPSARVMMIRYQRGSESTEQREAGFRETIQAAQAAGQKIELIEPQDEAGATVSSAQPVAERLLQKEQNLDVLFMPNESSTAGALAAMEALNLTDKIKLVGFDMSQTLISGMQTGKIQGLVLQDPFEMGYQSVKRIHDKLTGKPRTGDVVFYTGLAMLTKQNMEEPRLKNLYARQEQVVSGKK